MIQTSKALEAAADLTTSAALRRRIAIVLQSPTARARLCSQAETRGQMACEAMEELVAALPNVSTEALLSAMLLRDDVAACARALQIYLIACLRAGTEPDPIAVSAIEQLRLDSAHFDAAVPRLRAAAPDAAVPRDAWWWWDEL